MRIVEFGEVHGRAILKHGSHGFTVTPLASGGASFFACLRLAPGGVVGRHPATETQVFAVVAGSGSVSGEDGVHVPIGVGQAAVWAVGELHETRSDRGLTAMVLEGDDLQPLLPLPAWVPGS